MCQLPVTVSYERQEEIYNLTPASCWLPSLQEAVHVGLFDESPLVPFNRAIFINRLRKLLGNFKYLKS